MSSIETIRKREYMLPKSHLPQLKMEIRDLGNHHPTPPTISQHHHVLCVLLEYRFWDSGVFDYHNTTYWS